jgi:non-specific serine/threonine protein kinase/serine/threonine-protein kinase
MTGGRSEKIERWRQIKEVLAAALEASPADRAGVLDGLCANDAEIRGEVEKLLALESRANAALDSRAVPGALLREVAPPERIGAYRILREIGHGGMGVVYLGERADGEFAKQVAIKLITRGRPDAGLERRFRRERQILAQFEHAGIARLFDGGATEDGQPYFVMEYIDGLPLLEYCDSKRLSIDARLALFLKICDAVAHAHQRLIVHRDLKPANILVTSAGSPKLLDFGLARVLDAEQREDITQAGFPVMTPAYASPEQVRGELFTVSGDVYSLGGILYEMLSAHRPYNVPSGSLLEMVRVVCEQEPAPLSQAVADSADIAANRSTTLDRLRRSLAGDPETIVAKALEKDPRRRYGSVDELASDIRRHLDGLPVHARPATFGYRAGKMLRRHRVAIPVGALAAILILVFGGVALWQARRAQRRFEDVRKLAHSVMFDLHDAIAPLPGSTAARALLVRQAMDYLEPLSREAAGDPRLAREVALGYERIGTVQGYLGESNLGNVRAALESFQKAAAILERLGAGKSTSFELRRDQVRVLNRLAISYQGLGQFDNAKQTLDKSDAMAEATLRAHPGDPSASGDLAATDSQRADLFTSQGRYAEAIPVRQHVLALYQELAAATPADQEDQRSLALAHKKLAALLGVSQRLDESYREYDEARVIDEARSRANPSNLRAKLDLSYDYSDIGWVKGRLNDLPGKLASYRQALVLRQEAAKADPNDFRAATAVASSTVRIGNTLQQMHDPSAVGELERAIMLWKQLAEKPGSDWATVVELADAHRDLASEYEDLAARQRQYWMSAASEYEQARSLLAGLADKGVLPEAQYSTIEEMATKAANCRKSAPGS